jgi:hypothetical protein
MLLTDGRTVLINPTGVGGERVTRYLPENTYALFETLGLGDLLQEAEGKKLVLRFGPSGPAMFFDIDNKARRATPSPPTKLYTSEPEYMAKREPVTVEARKGAPEDVPHLSVSIDGQTFEA